MEEWQWSALEQAEQIRSGAVSPLELVEAAIARIERLEPELGALVDTRFEQAREEAAGELPDGPFRGVPMLLKDAVQHSAGDRYQHGLSALRDREFRSPEDSELVRRYRAAGFIVLGRTRVPEMTLAPTTEPLAHGPSRNPWQLDHSSGGSSGGSAAAVANNMVAVAHANDMGGSIRIPASCCGLVGLKPTRHRTSIAPYGHYWGPLLHEHVVTRTVADSAAVLDATAGLVAGEWHPLAPPARPWLAELDQPLPPLRIGLVLATPLSGPVDGSCRAATEQVATLLAEHGHAVEEVAGELLGDLNAWNDVGQFIAGGLAQAVDHWERHFGEPITDLEPSTAEAVAAGRELGAAELLAALDGMGRWSQALARCYGAYDLLLTPTLPVLPPRLGTMDPLQPTDQLMMLHGAMSSFLLPFNVTGQPAMSLPAGWSEQGLPIGVQLVARHGREDLLFRAASLLEAHGNELRWPDLAR